MTQTPVTYRPTPASSALAIAAALVVVGFLQRGSAVWLPLLGEAIGVAVLGVGVLVFYRRGREVLATATVVLGVAVTAAAVLAFATGGHRNSVMIIVIPGMLGTFLLALGLFPLNGSGSRGLVKAGAALVFVSVLAAGLFRAPTVTVLGAGVGTVLAWDAGEQAINVGEQLGQDAETKAIELTHFAGSVLVGGTALLTGVVLAGVSPTGISLPQFTLLIVAMLLFTLALHE